MRLVNFLTQAQVETIHRNALRVLSEIGVQVEHPEVRERLACIGGKCSNTSTSVRFSPQVVEDYVFANRGAAPRTSAPTIRVCCNTVQCYYLDRGNRLLPFDEEKFVKYIGLAQSLPLIETPVLLGLPFLPDGTSASVLPLAEKLYAWKYGASPAGGVQDSRLCEFLLDMFSCHASMSGKRLEDVAVAVGFLISPLRLARPECEQLLFFSKHGLKMAIGHFPSQGGSFPITFAGSMVLALAEQIFLFLLHRAFWEEAVFGVGGDVITMDMRKAVSCFGRPEQQRINAAFADIALFYGCPCYGHTGLTDAKLPSYEAGAQKAVGALMTALAVGCGTVEAGLMASDEICSPIQMILDHDLAGSLRALLAEPLVNDAECAFDEILACGAGGNFLDTDLTAQRYRTEVYRPQTWSYQVVDGWLGSGKKIDVDYAADIFEQFEKKFSPGSRISAEEETELRNIMAKAAKAGLE